MQTSILVGQCESYRTIHMKGNEESCGVLRRSLGKNLGQPALNQTLWIQVWKVNLNAKPICSQVSMDIMCRGIYEEWVEGVGPKWGHILSHLIYLLFYFIFIIDKCFQRLYEGGFNMVFLFHNECLVIQ